MCVKCFHHQEGEGGEGTRGGRWRAGGVVRPLINLSRLIPSSSKYLSKVDTLDASLQVIPFHVS